MSLADELANAIADLRDAAEQFMLDTCTIYRKTGDVNSSGISKPQYDSGTVTVCRWQPASGTTVAQDGKVFVSGIYEVGLPASTSITVNDYLLYAGRKFGPIFTPPIDALAPELVIQVREIK